MLWAGAMIAGAILAVFLGRPWLDGITHRKAETAARASLAKCAHDLRQPIQAIELYASALQRRVNSEEAEQILTRLHACVADAQARLMRLVASENTPSAALRTDFHGASIIYVGDRSAAMAEAESLFAARGARVEHVTNHPATLKRVCEHFDLVVENAGHGDPRYGIAFATALQGKAAALVIVDQCNSAIDASLSRNQVTSVTGLCTGEALVAASEAAMRMRSTSALQSLPLAS